MTFTDYAPFSAVAYDPAYTSGVAINDCTGNFYTMRYTMEEAKALVDDLNTRAAYLIMTKGTAAEKL